MNDPDSECPPTTDGEIAVINLQSARLRSWTRFFQDPLQPGVAEGLIEQEQFTAQFAGDLSALAAALRGRGWQVVQGSNALAISR